MHLYCGLLCVLLVTCVIIAVGDFLAILYLQLSKNKHICKHTRVTKITTLLQLSQEHIGSYLGLIARLHGQLQHDIRPCSLNAFRTYRNCD